MNIRGVATLVKKETWRFIVRPAEAIGPPVVVTFLYFIIFGVTIGPRIGDIAGISYLEFIMPGLVMMNSVIYAYSNVAYSLQLSKITYSLADIFSSPMSYFEIILGYTIGATIRGLLTAGLIYGTAIIFLPISIVNPFYLISFFLITIMAFGLLGLIIGLLAETFEQVSLLPTFFLTPLSFLGGIFYSIDMLPEFWHSVSRLNPVLYIINGLRFGFYGISDVNVLGSFIIVLLLLIFLFFIALTLFRTGYKVRS
jgi:ABC-2 type transport system permease protein